jgi:molybdopterin molybdotransferase
MKLLSVRAAQRRITDLLSPVATESVPVANALGRVLASDVFASDLPRFNNSSVDGFAVITADLKRAGPAAPRRLEVVADIPAGSYSGIRLRSGQAARIMTGAPVPRGATGVIMLEDTDQALGRAGAATPKWIEARRQLRAGENVRGRASDARRGTLLLSSGHQLRSQDLGLLAMVGRTAVRVHRKPRVALLSSGDELVAPGDALPPGGIRDTNTITLATLTASAGCDVLSLGVARDSGASIRSLLERGRRLKADLILSSAGVSVGALDLMREVIQERGQLHFWRVNVRPGKPLAVGEYGGITFIGLPGNPVSAYVGFELFVRPALDRLRGMVKTARRRFRATLAETVKLDGRESYLRVVVSEKKGKYLARLTGHQGSGNLISLVKADALLMVPAGVKSLAAGDQADAWWL